MRFYKQSLSFRVGMALTTSFNLGLHFKGRRKKMEVQTVPKFIHLVHLLIIYLTWQIKLGDIQCVGDKTVNNKNKNKDSVTQNL